ncbi:Kinesin-like protein [Nymphaea thermarum]|nr:Kinesin-like protein [Nymphaea thermarum]
MKNSGNQRGGILRGISLPESLPPKPRSAGGHRRTKSGCENVPPVDPNSQMDLSSSPSPASNKAAAKTRSPLPPRPPAHSNPGNPLKRKLNLECAAENGGIGCSDSGVMVVVRIRPLNKDEEGGEQIVQKTSPNSLSVLDQIFTFDSVAGTDSMQENMFQLVGVPLVENCLAGFNSSIFAYGQTGSGKTYTMWGPTHALAEGKSSCMGITPRVFEQLFSRIQEEQAKHSDKQLNYQCRCSFLEIYNEQITDLLDPSQKNLQIREDVKSGVYVENLTEEYVNSMEDLTQLLIKGLANRRVGATSINAESSRSHSVFTCVVESRCKSMADGLSSLRTSRINLVDLAGSERQKLTGAAGERLKEAGNINRSLSQLGNLINILAEVSQSGRQRHIPYRDSRLTFLLQESLGGNAKLAMICAVSPAQSCKSETLSTLRFAQRAKAIQNKAVVNEVTEDDVNVLREQIRQLKDELIRMKSNGNSQADSGGGYSTGWNARRSLNLLRMSLSRPSTLQPQVEDDSDEEMEIVEEGVEKVQAVLQSKETGSPAHLSPQPIVGHQETICVDQEETDVNMEDCLPDDKMESFTDPDPKAVNETSASAVALTVSESKIVCGDSEGIELADLPQVSTFSPKVEPENRLSIVPCQLSPVLASPTVSISPKVEVCSRKSLRMSSSLSPNQKGTLENSFNPESLNLSFALAVANTSATRTSKNFTIPTESIAASLQRGLQVIDNHQQSSALRHSSFRFSFKALDSKPFQPAEKIDVGVQTLIETPETLEDQSEFICSLCKKKPCVQNDNETDSVELSLVPVDAPQLTDSSKKQVPKAVEKVLAGAIRREMALEEFNSKQAAEIMQLNRLIQQYKHERECSAIIEQIREDKICRLEGLMDGVLPTEEFMEQELISLANEHKLLKDKYDNHPEYLRVTIELKRVQDELDQYRNFFDLGEREVLMEEVQNLRNQLQSYLDKSPKTSQKWNPPLQLTHAAESVLETVVESSNDDFEKRFEEERQRWTQTESEWISLSEDLRAELETSRSLAEKRELELNAEKKCSEELKEALQTAMQGHARILEQYAELQEKHIALLARHRKIRDGIADVKQAAAKAGVRGAESRFINSLAAEISALKAEREKERKIWKDQNNGLQAQLRDTAEAVQAAGELLVRLKESEEAVTDAKARALKAEQETESARLEMDKLKKKHEREIETLKQFLAETRLPKVAVLPEKDKDPVSSRSVEQDHGNFGNQDWREEFEPFYREDDESEFMRNTGPSWFSGYDRCNI